MSEGAKIRRPVPAVAAVIIRDGEILLVKRAYEPSKGKWSIPGGSVEWGEPLVEALKREVREETGLEIEVDGLAGVFDLIVSDRPETPLACNAGEGSGVRVQSSLHAGRSTLNSPITYHYILIDYFAHPTGGTLTPGDDASDARWVPLDDLDRYDLSDHLRDWLSEIGAMDKNS